MDDSIDLNPFRRRLLKHGESADARVLECEIPNNQSPGTSATHKFVVEVQPAGAPPFQATVKDVFSMSWAPKRGDLLKVKFNPKSRKVAFDLQGDPRYDYRMQKQTGQWTPGEAPPPSIFGTSPTGGVGSPGPTGATAGDSTGERLQQLARLRDAGLITAEDFETQKLRILESL